MIYGCEEFAEHLDDMLDNRLDSEERGAFLCHLKSCEKCRKEYEFSLCLKNSMREPEQKLGDDFTASVMERIDKLPKKAAHPSFTGFFRFAYPVAAAAVLCFALLLGLNFISSRQNELEEARTISLSSADDDSQESKKISENESEYITENYMKYLFDGQEVPDYGTYSEKRVLEILGDVVDGYVNDEYSYVCFVTVSDIDNLNCAEKTMYMPRTNNGDIMLFYTYLSQMDIVKAIGDELTDYYVINGSKDASKALLIVRMEAVSS